MPSTHHSWAEAGEGRPRETSLPKPGRHRLSRSSLCKSEMTGKLLFSLTHQTHCSSHRERGGWERTDDPQVSPVLIPGEDKKSLLLYRSATAELQLMSSGRILCTCLPCCLCPGWSFVLKRPHLLSLRCKSLTQMLPLSGSLPDLSPFFLDGSQQPPPASFTTALTTSCHLHKGWHCPSRDH